MKKILLTLLIITVFSACQLPGENVSETGTLSLNISQTRILEPAISMEVAMHEIIGKGPNAGDVFTEEITPGNMFTKAQLSPGNWDISVNAKNAAGKVIYTGSTKTILKKGGVTPVNITISPLSGTGSLNLSVTWPADKITQPVIDAQLIPTAGDSQPLVFTDTGLTRTHSSSNIATGYHTLVIKLLDNTELSAGAAEIVRIVKDETTTGTYVFDNLQEHKGTLKIKIIQDFKNPIPVTLDRNSGTVFGMQKITASVPPSTGNVTYHWYINGNLQPPSADMTNGVFIIPSDLVSGYYRMDVIAISADGSRAGSVTWNFEMESPELVSAGGSVNHVLTKSGTLWSWGYNSGYGLFENITGNSVLYPVETATLTGVSKIETSSNHMLVLKSDGTVLARGYNKQGQIGDGTAINRSAFVPINGLTNVIDISCGSNFSMALKGDGTVWTWGNNAQGQLGDGTNASKQSPVQLQELSQIVSISAGNSHALAVKSDGTVMAWGDNGNGQLGNNTKNNSYTPVEVLNLTEIASVKAASNSSFAHRKDGTVWSWGYNNNGELGLGTTAQTLTPQHIFSLGPVIQIDSKGNFAAALKEDGTVYTWGYGTHGQIGNSKNTNSYSPVLVINLDYIKSIHLGDSHALALKQDASLWSWGYNNYGNLGNGTTVNKNMPIQISY